MTSAPAPSQGGEPPRLIDVVLGPPLQQRRRVVSVASAWPWMLALVLHGVLWILARRSEPSLEAWSAQLSLKVHHELSAHTLPDIEPALAEPVAPAEPPPTAAEPLPAAEADRPRQTNSAKSTAVAPPAAAAQAVAVGAERTAPVDLSASTIVTGQATAYHGGATASRGTAPPPAATTTSPAPAVDHGNPLRGGRARAVSLSASEWQCPWPRTAGFVDAVEQSVILRVVVRADGSVESASVLRDPGGGFGPAAVACARATRFTPATDQAGKAVRAVSPPIRVRFTR
jgi:protein TonB